MIGYLELGRGPEQAYHALVTSIRFRNGALEVEAEMQNFPPADYRFNGYIFYGEDNSLIFESEVLISMPFMQAEPGDRITLEIQMIITSDSIAS